MELDCSKRKGCQSCSNEGINSCRQKCVRQNPGEIWGTGLPIPKHGLKHAQQQGVTNCTEASVLSEGAYQRPDIHQQIPSTWCWRSFRGQWSHCKSAYIGDMTPSTEMHIWKYGTWKWNIHLAMLTFLWEQLMLPNTGKHLLCTVNSVTQSLGPQPRSLTKGMCQDARTIDWSQKLQLLLRTTCQHKLCGMSTGFCHVGTMWQVKLCPLKYLSHFLTSKQLAQLILKNVSSGLQQLFFSVTGCLLDTIHQHTGRHSNFPNIFPLRTYSNIKTSKEVNIYSTPCKNVLLDADMRSLTVFIFSVLPMQWDEFLK